MIGVDRFAVRRAFAWRVFPAAGNQAKCVGQLRLQFADQEIGFPVALQHRGDLIVLHLDLLVFDVARSREVEPVEVTLIDDRAISALPALGTAGFNDDVDVAG